jgi:hypothetical protein
MTKSTAFLSACAVIALQLALGASARADLLDQPTADNQPAGSPAGDIAGASGQTSGTAVSKVSSKGANPAFPAWEGFVEELRALGPEMLAKLPERLRNDPQAQQEVGRLMLEALAARTLETIGADGDHPVFLPTLNLTLNVFQPNADTTYRTARITSGGKYRLRGQVGSLRIFKLGQFGPTPDETGGGIKALGYSDFSKLHLDKGGNFDVILSPTRPEGYAGDWWELNPNTTSVMIRQVVYDLGKERDPTVAIERLDKPIQRPRPSPADLEHRLSRLGMLTSNTALFFADHVDGLRREGYINKLKVFDLTNLGGLVGQFYYEGAYDLKPKEALILETKVPEKCTYSSIILTDDIYETTDWYNNQSSLNGSQVRVDHDGILRVVISAADPGVPNWLDTAGYPSGAIQGRWTDCAENPIPTIRKVALADVRRLLPAETPTLTPAQREQTIRDRRALLQQRPLW